MNRQTVMEIDKDAFFKNIENIKKLSGNKELMYIMKANSYGTYLNKHIDIIKDFKIIGVAIVKEAIELRQIGFKNEIFVLNQPYVEDIPNIIKYNITVGVSDITFIKELIKYNKRVNVHLELETGMGRTGVLENDLIDVVELLQNKNICVNGAYTHLSCPDSDSTFTENQISVFKKEITILRQYFALKYIHLEASNGLLNYNVDFCNLVRVGILLYGYKSSNDTLNKIVLNPVAKLKSKICFIKEVAEHFSVSYGKTYITDRITKIATVGIGYADGIRRSLSNKGEVIIKNKKCKIIGTVCMDSFMVDVTGVDALVGDDVYIWDNDIITVDEIALELGTINYEILSTISDRVERIIV